VCVCNKAEEIDMYASEHGVLMNCYVCRESQREREREREEREYIYTYE